MTKEQQKQHIIFELHKVIDIFKLMGVPACLTFYMNLLQELQTFDPLQQTSVRLKVAKPDFWPSPHENAAGYVKTLNNFFITAGVDQLCTLQFEFATEDTGTECYALLIFKELSETLDLIS